MGATAEQVGDRSTVQAVLERVEGCRVISDRQHIPLWKHEAAAAVPTARPSVQGGTA